MALALLLLPWAVALVQELRHHHLDGGAIGIVATLSVGLPALWLAWVAYRDTTRADQVSGLTMVQVADQLAVAVRDQWEVEAAIRRLNDPYPLPVSWVAADSSLTDPWDSLVRQATSAVGWHEPAPAEGWAAGPDGLAGTAGEMVDVLARVPTRRLVVLGEPGSGKTMLMVRLVLDLLARRTGGTRVPILVSIASWNPADQDLRSWLSDQLMIDHSALASAPPAGMDEPTRAAALLASGLILPILDGLDEVPEGVRGVAISRINDALRPGESLLLTCRTQQYWEAIAPAHGLEVAFRGAAAVELRPLDAAAVRGYLYDDAAGPAAKARWNPVFAVLGTETPAGQALTTPLMVSLARAIYNPRPGESLTTLRDPAELCNPGLTDRTAVEALLFDAFIPAAYRQTDGWKAQDAEKWLTFLAYYLDRTIGTPDLAWWQLPRGIPRFAWAVGSMVLVGIAACLGTGLAAFVRGGGVAVGIAVAGALAVALAALPAAAGYKRLPPPSRGVNWRLPYRIDIVLGAAVGVVAGALAGAGLLPGVKPNAMGFRCLTGCG